MGERWSFMILRAAFNGVHQFEEFQQELGIARNILSNRLSKLVNHGIMAREVSLVRTPALDSSVLNTLPARITSLTKEGPGQVLVSLDASGVTLLSRITQRSRQTLALEIGDQVYAQVKAGLLLD